MRSFLIFLFVLLLAAIGYAYYTNPAGCQKVVNDIRSVATSLWPGHSPSQAASSVPPAPVAVAPQPAPATTSEPVPLASTPSSAPIKAWAPPAVMPAQPNWSWTALDGTTYQNVVVTKIEPDTVSITHSLGVAHIAINMLPPDIQKALNYDPVAAAAAKAEIEREAAHPYYTIANLADAQAVARSLHWPLAWICGFPGALTTANPESGSEDEATQMAVNHLKSRAIIIFLNGDTDLITAAVPPFIREQQFFQLDDGILPGGHHFYAPKIVFSDADITKALGRVSYTQMKASGEAAIDDVLSAIPADAPATPPSNNSAATATSAPSAPATTSTPAPAPATTTPVPETTPPPAPTASPTPSSPVATSIPVTAPDSSPTPAAPVTAPASSPSSAATNPAPDATKSSQ